MILLKTCTFIGATIIAILIISVLIAVFIIKKYGSYDTESDICLYCGQESEVTEYKGIKVLRLMKERELGLHNLHKRGGEDHVWQIWQNQSRKGEIGSVMVYVTKDNVQYALKKLDSLAAIGKNEEYQSYLEMYLDARDTLMIVDFTNDSAGSVQ